MRVGATKDANAEGQRGHGTHDGAGCEALELAVAEGVVEVLAVDGAQSHAPLFGPELLGFAEEDGRLGRAREHDLDRVHHLEQRHRLRVGRRVGHLEDGQHTRALQVHHRHTDFAGPSFAPARATTPARLTGRCATHGLDSSAPSGCGRTGRLLDWGGNTRNSSVTNRARIGTAPARESRPPAVVEDPVAEPAVPGRATRRELAPPALPRVRGRTS